MIAATAAATVIFDPFRALIAGTVTEGGRLAVTRALCSLSHQ